ncbi:MAG TPA: hypothetical protein VGM88_09765 [Kofleriaceae bacterium]|jgi:hypothetical protein
MTPARHVRLLHRNIGALLCSTLVAFGGVAACGGGAGETCAQDSDCPGSFCKADGTCAASDGSDGGSTPDGSGGDGDTLPDSGACSPNHDNKIEASELPLAAGRMANYRVATNATFATAGTANGDGTRSWDLSGELSNDTDTAVVLSAPTGAWWASDFPTATYATQLSASADLLGVFHVDATSVTLLGVVSPASGLDKTELAYDPAVTVLQVPFGAGDTWTTTSTVTGPAEGIQSFYTEEYTSLVDEVGTMKTPYGTFPVLRVATDMDRTEGITPLASSRTFSWTAECFGQVATVTSQDFESGAEFTDDAEVRRIAP